MSDVSSRGATRLINKAVSRPMVLMRFMRAKLHLSCGPLALLCQFAALRSMQDSLSPLMITPTITKRTAAAPEGTLTLLERTLSRDSIFGLAASVGRAWRGRVCAWDAAR